MDAIVGGDVELIGVEVILDSRKRLNNIATLSTDVEVVQSRARGENVRRCTDTIAGANLGTSRTGQKSENVAAVLKSSSELCSVDGKAESLVRRTNIDIGILLNRGLNALTVIVVETGIDHPGIVVISGHVVSKTQNTTLRRIDTGWRIAGDARDEWKGPVIAIRLTVTTVSKMVDSAPWSLDTFRGINAKRRNALPSTVIGNTSSTVVVADTVVAIGGVKALILSLHVLALGLVEWTKIKTIGHDHNITPWAGVPVGIVVALLRALISSTIVVGVLASEDSGAVSQIVVLEILIGSEKTSVSLPTIATVIPLPALVKTALQDHIVVLATEIGDR